MEIITEIKKALHQQPFDLSTLINECGAITKSKGFDVTQHATQIALIATEVAEALENIGYPADPTTQSEIATANYIKVIITESKRYEAIRANTKEHLDASSIVNVRALLEEQADICLRVFSHVSGNDLTEEFIAILQQKMEKNRNRQYKHGKGF